MLPETYAALLSIAAAIVDPKSENTLNTQLAKITNWQDFTNQAEMHGLSVMIGHLCKTHDLGLPRMVELQFKALTVRHQKVLKARETVLKDVIDIYERNNIKFALLKGAALSPLIYDPPWLRPMRDIDILVKPSDAHTAQTLLREIGFENEDFKQGYLFDHHHLPNSARVQDGFTMSLEVHHDALSGDVDASIKLDQIETELHAFNLSGKRAFSLGHADVLKHLCHHTFEPAKVIKLGSMIDLVRYANQFSGEINWSILKKEQPRIENTLRCIDALLALPKELKNAIGFDQKPNWKPTGLGHGFTPLSQTAMIANKKAKLSALFMPPQWWMHIFYVVPPGRSLLYTQTVRHPIKIVKWLIRRYWAAHKSKQAAV